MKKILSVFILLIFAASAVAAPPALPPDGPYTDTNCNQSQYYPIGKLCSDTDDAKLYKGTGSAVVEISNVVTGLTSASSVAITGGTIDGTTIGSTTPAAGTFTTVTANTSVSTDTIAEKTGGAGVTIDGVLIKDSAIPVANITGAAASADLATDNSTASHAIYKDSSGNIANQVLSIDAHAGSTTITLIPGICPVIHNTSQGDANITNALPAVASGLCFTALVVTAEDDKTWRFTAAAVNTICLGTTCGKDDIGFATTKVVKGAMFKCVAQGTEWFCNIVTGEPDAGDL